jgi:hypothetical protein
MEIYACRYKVLNDLMIEFLFINISLLSFGFRHMLIPDSSFLLNNILVIIEYKYLLDIVLKLFLGYELIDFS